MFGLWTRPFLIGTLCRYQHQHQHHILSMKHIKRPSHIPCSESSKLQRDTFIRWNTFLIDLITRSITSIIDVLKGPYSQGEKVPGGPSQSCTKIFQTNADLQKRVLQRKTNCCLIPGTISRESTEVTWMVPRISCTCSLCETAGLVQMQFSCTRTSFRSLITTRPASISMCISFSFLPLSSGVHLNYHIIISREGGS
ncbi:uncharacterized protein EV420DRAFT_1580193 [Desarmillaria tabescens]|uniref:Uncharacterized protein n=1 Tax=Armillaria tabescens TaxID=1929756 RepID=A0AA39JEW5_ARMTA|nr:uncharacterized protein EV420DRAFT_1580193 [Desarmillaria tabescens]KAK0441490.1 hypothetical protein EV420DRAFT_1580193 [Desarmillaria tabescens]